MGVARRQSAGASRCFEPDCRACPRLAAYLDDVRERYPDYHARPVPPFGDARARLLIVGLAPGLHGANATGRPFTGDHAGILLYRTLFELGLASAPVSTNAGDGLKLHGCRITNAVKCVPPANKPGTGEIRRCNGFLQAELAGLPERAVIIALGTVAHRAVLLTQGLTASRYAFAHGSLHHLPGGFRLLDSYHCSRYNTQTGRLTMTMFRRVFKRALRLVESG